MGSPYAALPPRTLSRLSGSQSLHEGPSQLPKRSQSLRSPVPLSPRPKRRPGTRRKLEVACRTEVLYYDDTGGLLKTETVDQVWPSTCKRKKAYNSTSSGQKDWEISPIISKRPSNLLGGFVNAVAETGPATRSYFCSIGKSQVLPTIQVDKGLLLLTFLKAGKAGVKVTSNGQEYLARQNDVLTFQFSEEFELRNLSTVCPASVQVIECMI